MSTLRAHKARCQAKAQATNRADPAAAERTDLTAQEQMLGLLAQHKSKLAGISSYQNAAQVKEKIVTQYADYIDGVIAADEGGQDDIITHNMVWLFDINEFDRALDLAEYVLHHNLAMPQHFERNADTFVAGVVADAYLKHEKPNAEQIIRTIELLQDADVHDKVAAKLHKSYGSIKEQKDPATALVHLKRAYELDAGCGVKKTIAKLEKTTNPADE